MSKRLVKIAQELNVGTSTIVDFLSGNGFSIENKPNAKITEDMERALLKEFQKSHEIKKQADQMVIGNRPTSTKPEEAPAKPEPVVQAPKPEPKPPVEEKAPAPDPVPEKEKPAVVEPEKETAPAVKEESKRLPGLNVKGKIDLDKSPKAPVAKETPEPPKPEKETPPAEEPAKVEEPTEAETPAAPKETPAPEPKSSEAPAETPEPAQMSKDPEPAQQPEETPAPEQKEEKTPAPAAEKPTEEQAEPAEPATDASPEKEAPKKGDDFVRAATPELRGLKIIGKVELQDTRPKKKKKPEPVAPAAKAPGVKASPTDESGKRKRKRRKVAISPDATQNKPGVRPKTGGKPGQDDQPAVSNKEIEDKIKATMARISGGGKKKRQKLRRDNRDRIRERQEMMEMSEQNEKLQVTEFISVQDLANMMDVPAAEVIMTCMNVGVIVAINQRLDAEIIELVASEFGHEVEFISAEDEIETEVEVDDAPEDLIPRAPIVTVMGHVDHGKTSLLDFIREANVAEGEAGGITQHIGAYEVKVGPDDRRITFLDTPGHEAFTAMRARGAKVTDVAVIIIAADDNIMPQTKEAISHAQAANVPMVFAINKIDKDGAQPERIKQELASMNLLVEEWGGDYQSQDISAKTGLNIDLLLEKILLAAELLELEANPNRAANGTILEASLDKGRGYVTKALVQYGTLRIGDPMVAGEHSGKVKAMFNEKGKRIKEAGPSSPVLVLGLSGAPQAGERFKVMESEQDARQLASKRSQITREQATRSSKRISLDEIGRRLALGSFKELNLIVKGDVDGSIEALADSLIKLSIESVQVNVIHKAVGQIIEADVLLASASDAIVIGFQVRPSVEARRLAEREGVQIKTYSIIYEAIEEIKSAIEGMLEPTREEQIVANLEVREIFKISKLGTIAGCLVTDGKITRNTRVRVIRDGIVVYPTREGVSGELGSLKRLKDDAKEVKSGLECGVTIKNFNDIKVGDVIEGFEIIEVKQKLS